MHRGCAVGLVVDEPGNCSYRAARNQLLDEDHSTAERPVGMSTADVEPEIDFLERAVTRNPDSLDSGVDEAEANQTNQVNVTPPVEFGTTRDQRCKEFPRTFEIQEDQALPSCRQEWFSHVRI